VEQGELDRLHLGTLGAIADALGIAIDLEARWQGSRGDHLLDRAHAALVELVVKKLQETCWQTIVEYSFNRYGDRGSVDVAAWREERAALLILEVKTRVVDVQDLLSTLDRKARIVPGELARERGWRGRYVGVFVVLPDGSGPRDAVARHAMTFGSALPGRTREVRRWLLAPEANLRAIWFVHATPGAGTTNRSRFAHRISDGSGQRGEREAPRSTLTFRDPGEQRSLPVAKPDRQHPPGE
jgi:hypothetical protein